MVVTDNQISDRKAEVARLKQQDAAARARAERLAAYTQFGSVRDQRVATVTSLADSRFDWERVMRELSLILPDDVWLTNLTGKANPAVQIDGEANVALRHSIAGPALELVGCARGQEAVARFVSALKDIDGVTRVGVQSSQLGTQQSGGGTATTLRHRHQQRQLPDPRLRRPVPDRRRLRRRPGSRGRHRRERDAHRTGALDDRRGRAGLGHDDLHLGWLNELGQPDHHRDAGGGGARRGLLGPAARPQAPEGGRPRRRGRPGQGLPGPVAEPGARGRRGAARFPLRLPAARRARQGRARERRHLLADG